MFVGWAGDVRLTNMSQHNYRFNELALSDLARIGLVLDGQSVIDWPRLYCRDLDDAEQVLERVGFDCSDS